MKVRHVWSIALVTSAALIGACSDGQSATDDDSDGSGASSSGAAGPGGGIAGPGVGGGGPGVGGGGPGSGGSATGGGMMMSECYSPGDCGDPAAEICSLATETCEASECDPTAMQPAGCAGADPFCLEQRTGSGNGACYEICDPYDVACPGGMECVSLAPGQEIGVCHNPGGATAGQPCNPGPHPEDTWLTNSGCAAGHTCSDDGNGNDVCFETCDFFGTPDCSGTAVCYPGGICDEPEGGAQDAVAVGADCTGASGGELCGLTGGRDGYEGTCQDIGEGMICHPYCDAVGKYTCPAPFDSCYNVFGPPLENSVGLCGSPPATGCNNATDCDDSMTEICDVESETCQGSECDPNATQPGGCAGTDPICLLQDPMAAIGACYETCDPYDTPCPGGGPSACENNTFSQSFGVCMNAGTGAPGMACSPLVGTTWGTTTGCVPGYQCISNECQQTCDFFGAPTCNGATVCTLFGICELPGGGTWDNVALGDPCVGASGGEDCGLIGGHDGYQGVCFDFGDQPIGETDPLCRPICSFDDNTCAGSPWDGNCYDLFQAPHEGDIGTCLLP